MSVADIRATIVDAIQGTDAGALVDPSVLAAFEAGERDVALEDLHLDSIMRMELMVALEMEHDAVLTPQIFAKFESLAALAEHVELASVGMGASRESDLSEGVADMDDPAPQVVRLFQRAFGSCRSVAHVDRLIWRFENCLTPLEAGILFDWQGRGRLAPGHAPDAYKGVISAWLERLERWMGGSGKPEPEPFASHRIAPAAFHFNGPGERAAKTLVICFSNIGSRIVFVPNPVLLQHFDASTHDLLILADPRSTAFRSGVPHMGATVSEVVQWVADLKLLQQYARLRVLGGNAGAYPAMLAGRRLNAELTVGLSGRFPSERYMGTILKMYANCLISYLRTRRARVLLVHGTKRRGDAAYARRLSRLTGASRLAVDMPDRNVEHNILQPLIEHGELAAFLARTVLAPTDSPWFAPGRTSETTRFPVE